MDGIRRINRFRDLPPNKQLAILKKQAEMGPSEIKKLKLEIEKLKENN